MAQPTLLGTPADLSAINVPDSSLYTSFTYTVSAGSDRLLLLFIGTGDTAFGAATAVTYGGQSMTQVPSWLVTDNNWVTNQCWYLKEAGIAAAGSNIFSIDWLVAIAASIDQVWTAAAVFQGVDQSSTFGTTVTATATSSAPTSGSITLTADQIAVGAISTDSDNSLTEGSTLLVEEQNVGPNDTSYGAQYRTTTGALAWTTDSQPYAIGAVPINGISAGGGRTTKNTRQFPLGMELGMNLWGRI